MLIGLCFAQRFSITCIYEVIQYFCRQIAKYESFFVNASVYKKIVKKDYLASRIIITCVN